jgi:hypothetical protein
MDYQDIKKNIQDLLDTMKIEGRKPCHVEKMKDLLVQRDRYSPSHDPIKIVHDNPIKNNRKVVIPYPSLPPHIKRRSNF